MIFYLLSALVVALLLLLINQNRILNELRKKDKAFEISMRTLHQWIVSNDTSVIQNLGRINELMDSLYVRTRMIDLLLRNKTNADKQIHGHGLQELEALLSKEHWSSPLINETTHREAIEKIRSEDIHHYYTMLIEELQQLNRQMGRGGIRGEIGIGAGNTPAGRSENAAPVNGWYNRVNRVG
jgi:hypothetical protein